MVSLPKEVINNIISKLLMQVVICSATIVVLLYIPDAWALDSSPIVQLPRMQIAPNIYGLLEEINIVIANDSLKAEYTFSREEDRLLSKIFTISFDILPYRWLGITDDNPDKSFSDLLVELNGEKVSYKKDIKALFDGMDITNKLHSFSIPPALMNDFEAWPKDNQQNREKLGELIRLGIITPVVTGEPYILNWWLHPYFWLQPSLSAYKKWRVGYTHKVIWGFGSLTPNSMYYDKNIDASLSYSINQNLIDIASKKSLFNLSTEKMGKIFSALGMKSLTLEGDLQSRQDFSFKETSIPLANVASRTPLKHFSIKVDAELDKANKVILLRLSDQHIYHISGGTLQIDLKDFCPREDPAIVIFFRHAG